jgi:biopolymer transport protein ExbD
MLGCAVVLLIVEMTCCAQVHQSLPFDRYISRNAIAMPAALRNDAIKIQLARDGVIYFEGARIAGGVLPGRLRQRLRGSAPHRVFLIVDQRAQFGDLSVVLDDVRRAGAWDVAFLTELRALR